MNYTQNHHLPQWEKDDRIMMEDFNAMCASMESGLNQTAAEAARASSAAQATADQAVSAAAKAQAAADQAYTPSRKPYVIGSYTGTEAEQHISLGFRPRFVIITASESSNTHLYTLMAGDSGQRVQLEFTSSGFTVRRNTLDTGGREASPWIVATGKIYNYIAFR